MNHEHHHQDHLGHHRDQHHEHNLEHKHGEDCSCQSCRQSGLPNVKIIDGSIVGSLSFEVSCKDRLVLEQQIIEELSRVSRILEAEGGIVGHAKAAFEQTTVSKISVIDDQSTIDRVMAPVVKGDLVVIAFRITEDRMYELLEQINFSENQLS